MDNIVLQRDLMHRNHNISYIKNVHVAFIRFLFLLIIDTCGDYSKAVKLIKTRIRN